MRRLKNYYPSMRILFVRAMSLICRLLILQKSWLQRSKARKWPYFEHGKHLSKLMKKNNKQAFLNRWQETKEIPPQTVGPITPVYKEVTKRLKTMPFPLLVLGSLFLVVGLLFFFHSSVVSFVSLLQRGFWAPHTTNTYYSLSLSSWTCFRIQCVFYLCRIN